MSTPAESSSPNSPAVSPSSAVSPDVDEHLHGVWQKYGQAAVLAALLVLAFYLGREGWNYFGGQREAGVQAEFAAARTPDQLKAFVAAHPDHALAGLADLQVADQAYAAGQESAALSSYNDASRILKDPALQARATIGAAMTQIQLGQTADGQAALRKLMDDTKQLPVIRAEAGYQLATLAAAAGQAEEVQHIAVQLMQIDKEGPWTRNVFNLTVAKPAGGLAVPPSVSLKPAGK